MSMPSGGVEALNFTGATLISNFWTLQHEAHQAAEKLKKIYHEALGHLTERSTHAERAHVMKKMDAANRFQHLAICAEYIMATRMSVIAFDKGYTVFVDQAGAESFKNLANGHAYSLEELSRVTNWVENVRQSLDPRLSKRELRCCYKEWDSMVEAKQLRQINDPFMKAESMEGLRQTELGTMLLDDSIATGCDIHFMDMTPTNLVSQDLGEGEAGGLYYHNGGKGCVLVDTSPATLPVQRYVYLAHELGHDRHFKERYRRRPHQPTKRSAALLDRHTGFLEAYCIGIELMMARQFLDAGFSLTHVMPAMRLLPEQTINLLASNPEAFIHEIGTSEMVRKEWRLTRRETRPAPRTERELAASLPRLSGISHEAAGRRCTKVELQLLLDLITRVPEQFEAERAAMRDARTTSDSTSQPAL